MPRKSLDRVEITPRDIRIFLSLWRWKVATTAAIAEEFFGGRYVDSAYLRLHRLAKAGFIGYLPLPDTTEHLWCLKAPGLAKVKYSFPEHTEQGIGIEYPWHDYLTTALHRGPWLGTDPEGVETVSEQELRRWHPEILWDWVPSKMHHRSDGYTQITKRDGTSYRVALEVELHRKKPAHYQFVSLFYQLAGADLFVLWLVSTRKNASLILRDLAKGASEVENRHAFVTVPDFIRSGWNAVIALGLRSGQSIHNLLSGGLSHAYLHREPIALLDRRKRPYRSPRYEVVKESLDLNRVAPQAPLLHPPHLHVISTEPQP